MGALKKNDAKLLFTDTDSLVYETEIDDVYEDFCKDKNLFDFSDYPRDSRFFDPANKNVIDKMKDEFKGKITSVFVGLKWKKHSLVDVDESKKAKGVNRSVVKNTRYKECVDVWFNETLIR